MVCIHVGLLDIARRTYTEVVDDISGMKWVEIHAHETMDAFYFLHMMYSTVRGCLNVG